MFSPRQRESGGTAIGNGSKVRPRGSLVCCAVAHGSVAATLLWAIPVHAADDVTELLVQVKKQLEQSQHQMEQSHRQLEQSQRQLEQSQREVKALKQQVEVLTKRVEQTLVAPARDVAPAPDAKDAVVMRNVDALPPVPKKSPSISVRSVANSLGVRVSFAHLRLADFLVYSGIAYLIPRGG